MSKNPFHKFTLADGSKQDVNVTSIRNFGHATSGVPGEVCVLTFHDGQTLVLWDSATTVRNRIKKTWPDHTTTTDVVIDNGAEG